MLLGPIRLENLFATKSQRWAEDKSERWLIEVSCFCKVALFNFESHRTKEGGNQPFEDYRHKLVKTFTHPDLEEVPLSTVMLALADSSRMKIVRTLMEAPDREFSCKEIDLGVAKPTVSHHFETLRNAGIIQTRSEGTRRLSSLRTKDLKQRFPGLIDLLAAES